jgi:circadian clock protein KaiC
VLPGTSLLLNYKVSSLRVSSGIPELDEMLYRKGFFKGSSIDVSGTGGTGKSSIAASFVNARCFRKEPCIYLPFEESPGQIIRNMKSIGRVRSDARSANIGEKSTRTYLENHR